MIAESSFLPKINFSTREMGCFTFAVLLHSLLFLWKGGLLNFPDVSENLGDTLVNVDFMSEVPNYDAGGSGEKPKGLMAKVKAMIRGERPAGGNEAVAFKDKVFTPKTQKGFAGLIEKKEAMDVAVGQNKDTVVVPSQGKIKAAQANLKEKDFQVSRKSVPFPIVSAKSPEALANVNAIAMVIGNTTSESIKSLDGGPGTGPAVQSKSFSSKGKEFSAGSAFEKSGSASGKEESGLLAMGGGAGSGTAISAGMGAGVGAGKGAGNGAGTGFGNGSGAGRAWSGGGTGRGTGMAALKRNIVPDTVSTGQESRHKTGTGFSITGPLAKRPVIHKTQPAYEIDARVALRFRVDWSGKVLDGIIVEISSGNPSFDSKVIAALKLWIFSSLPTHRSNEIQEGVITFLFKGV